MKGFKQMDCFKINLRLWKFLGIYPFPMSRPLLYGFYSKIFIFCNGILFSILFSVNLFFLPKNFDYYTEELLVYFTAITITSKILLFLFKKNKVLEIIRILESEILQPETKEARDVIGEAKRSNERNTKMYMTICTICNLCHILAPMLKHLILNSELVFPICSYSYMSDYIRHNFRYQLYFYQAFGMHCLMLSSVNMDTFFVGLMLFLTAQLEIVNKKLMNVTEDFKVNAEIPQDDAALVLKLNKVFAHYQELTKFCSLIEDIFSISIFIQFSMSNAIICICLVRITIPATWQYNMYLWSYTFVIIVQIFIPCLFGNRIIHKSSQLQQAIYGCDWIPRSKRFKSSLRLFVERTSRPLSITGWKMFPLSLKTFTSIMNTAYSFFTLLRNMRSQ